MTVENDVLGNNMCLLKQDDILLQQSELRCQQTMHLIADMELMARADYLVGTLLPYEACFILHYDHLPEVAVLDMLI